MKCKYCGKEFSYKVLQLHMKICEKRPTEEQLKKEAEKQEKKILEAKKKEALEKLKKLPEYQALVSEKEALEAKVKTLEKKAK